MTEGLVKQSIAELQDIVRCRCRDAYKVRGLHDPGCECDSADAVQVVADRIEELEAKLAKAVGALDDLISTYVWVREDEYERGWSEMSNAVHEATFVQMELKGAENE